MVDYQVARSILGADFISADEIATARGLAYTKEQLTLLERKLPDQATLEAFRNTGMAIVARPPTAMTMLDVRAINAEFFHSRRPEQNDSAWYDQESEKFACTDRVEALGWIAFYKKPVEGSLGKTWTDQRALVARPMMVMNAAEATWALTTYKAVRDIYLLDKLGVRTSSQVSGGDRVSVGIFDAKGLSVYSYWDDSRGGDLGLSAGRKF